jgi:hypothetical protein
VVIDLSHAGKRKNPLLEAEMSPVENEIFNASLKIGCIKLALKYGRIDSAKSQAVELENTAAKIRQLLDSQEWDEIPADEDPHEADYREAAIDAKRRAQDIRENGSRNVTESGD